MLKSGWTTVQRARLAFLFCQLISCQNALFFTCFFFLNFKLNTSNHSTKIFVLLSILHKYVIYPETSLHEHILWMGELLLRQCLPCLFSFKLIMTAYLILVIFYIFMNTNMCHGCHSIFYNANFRDYLVIAFWKENVKYKTKIARREVLL